MYIYHYTKTGNFNLQVNTRYINGISMSEVQTDIGNINISNSQSASVVDRITPGLAIKYVAYGKESYQLKNRDLSISKGQFFLLRNNTYFKASNSGKHKITKGCCVNLNLEELLFPKKILDNDLLFETSFSAINSSILGMNLHDFTSKREFNSEYLASKIPSIENMVQLFSNDIYEYETKLFGIYKKKKTLQSILESLFQSREYIHQNYTERIVLDDLVKASGISKYHLLRLFSRCFGISPLQFQQDLKMKTALKLIKSQSLSLTDIAISLGYTDLASFSNHFKVKFESSPSKYLNSL